jgi:hypothetical protein
MTLLQEITIYGEAFWAGVISAEFYYTLVDMAIEYHTKEK